MFIISQAFIEKISVFESFPYRYPRIGLRHFFTSKYPECSGRHGFVLNLSRI